jgi:hypothetical protein
MKNLNTAASPSSAAFTPFLDELCDLAQKHGFAGVAVVAFMTGGTCEMAACGDDHAYPSALKVLTDLRNAGYMRQPAAGSA